jgi:hypothetical protein
MKFFFKSTVGALVAALLLATAPAFAQLTSGNIAGSVYDPSGATIPGAQVVAKNTATGVESTTSTTSAGEYRFVNLPVGIYDLAVTSSGFIKSEIKGVNVQLNATVTSNVKLSVGQAATTVEVTESAAAIDTTTAQIQSTVEARQLSDMPNVATGAGILNASLLNAGVASSGMVGAGEGPSVGGQRPRNNNFTIEGIDNNSGSITGPVVTVPNDAVAEFSMMQNQFSPEFGHSSGGQFNTVVTSGTNAFHGKLYEYFQNRDLNAADNLASVDGTPLHPRYDNNRFGGAVGGPIKHNKLFFFADYEYNPYGQAGSAGLIYAPTAAGYNTIAANPGVNPNNLSILKQYLGTASSAVPASTFQNGYPLLSTLGAGAAYKQPSISGTPIELGQVSIATPNYGNNEYAVTSIDYNISDKDSLRGRFILNRTGIVDTNASLPAFFTNTPTNAYIGTFSEYHNFTANMVNEFRFGYNRQSQDYPAGNFSFPGLDQFPNLQFNDLNVQLGPDPNAPQFGYQNIYQLTDNLSWTRGSHNLKFGFDGQRNISPQAFTQRSRGDYEYTNISDYLLDFTPDYYAQRSAGNPIYWGNRWMWGGYVNDNWKIRPNLTVNLGVRYEYQTVPAGELSQTLNSEASVPGLISFNAPKAQGTNIMPRIGLAYSPGTSGKTSIRAGFGINYDVLFDNLGLLTLPPQLSTTQDVTGDGGSGFLASGGLPANIPGGGSLSPDDARANTAGYVPPVKRPESYQWNFGIQHEFGGNYIFETQYIGTRGTYLPVQTQLNYQPVVTAANALPVYWSMPSVATLNGLTNNLGTIQDSFNNNGNIVPAYLNNNFLSPITAYMPNGNSVYHGWANTLSRRFNNGLEFKGAYTWSHAIDDSTAEVFSTYSTPRRPQDSQNLRPDRSSSALDARNRVSVQVLYDLPFFKHSNWFMKNLVGNWEFAPIYTYQTGTYYTVQAGADANQNGDAAPDRALVNPNGGNPTIGSTVTAVCQGPTAPACPNTAQAAALTVGYVVNNPNAGYAATPIGALATAGRNTARLNPINNVDITAAKRISITERVNLEFAARAFNVFNHSQYTGGYLNDITPIGATSTDQATFFQAGSATFGNPSQVFSSNPRTMVLSLKLLF